MITQENPMTPWAKHIAEAEKLTEMAASSRINNATAARLMLDQAQVHLEIAQTLAYVDRLRDLPVAVPYRHLQDAI